MSTTATERPPSTDRAAPPAAVAVERDGDVVTLTLDRPQKRNALALDVMVELTDALTAVGDSDALGVVLAANGPVFSAGHNFGDMSGASLDEARHLFEVCTQMMDTIQSIPQPVVAKVHALATAAGCQLVASCDLAVAAESAGFAIPGGKGGLFCHTPLVAVSRNIGRKRALEMALTGDVVDAATAAQWGLINRVVPDDELDDAVDDLVARVTRGSALSRALGKRAFYAQVGLDQPSAYRHAVEVMASAAMIPDAQEGFAAFLEKRHPEFHQRAKH
ncbi:MAG: enoyl-CoA hydratase/isomerase family protein [Acidimicrobiia bacterium]|nr:enoyl-CoA hydratase/isomerase family protein [Acidimicrobiia bacterium]